MSRIEILPNNSYKIGVDEIEGLKAEMNKVFEPIVALLNDKIYWRNGDIVTEAEYKWRDGFIPHSDNCGGIQIRQVIPRCEEQEFSFLEFGETDCAGNECDPDCCSCDDDGQLDSFLRVWFKFEGIQEDGSLKFYLYMGGGNQDAPYFRTEPTIFEAEFSCKSVAGLKRASSNYIKLLLKELE